MNDPESQISDPIVKRSGCLRSNTATAAWIQSWLNVAPGMMLCPYIGPWTTSTSTSTFSEMAKTKQATYNFSPAQCVHLETLLPQYVDYLKDDDADGCDQTIAEAAAIICTEAGIKDEAKKESVTTVRILNVICISPLTLLTRVCSECSSVAHDQGEQWEEVPGGETFRSHWETIIPYGPVGIDDQTGSLKTAKVPMSSSEQARRLVEGNYDNSRCSLVWVNRCPT